MTGLWINSAFLKEFNEVKQSQDKDITDRDLSSSMYLYININGEHLRCSIFAAFCSLAVLGSTSKYLNSSSMFQVKSCLCIVTVRTVD